MMLCRVGEATNPGPPVSIGTFNSCGVIGKCDLLADLPDGVYGISETHVSSRGMPKLQHELHCHVPGARIIHGPPLVSTSLGSYGGRATGVAAFSRRPVRAMTSEWDSSLWSTGRIQAVAAYLAPLWIKMGICYGYATDPYRVETMAATDALLEQLTQRIVFDSEGPRAIVGDFNHSKGQLAQFKVWQQNGFVELQTWAHQQWGQAIQPTYRQATTVDFVWVSRELLPFLTKVVVDSSLFPDHALVRGEFEGFSSIQPVPVWRKPLPIDWQAIATELPSVTQPIEIHNDDPEGSFRQIMESLEQRAHEALQVKGSGLLPQQRGRATTIEPKLKVHAITPLRRSRKHDVQVLFMGENYNHMLWTRQLRRLQSMCRLVNSVKDDCHVRCHKRELWKSIRAAKGFDHGFPRFWVKRPIRLRGAPDELPREPPTAAEIGKIFHTFQCMYKQLEETLNKARWKSAVQRRQEDANVVFSDVAKQKALPVQTIMSKHVIPILDISSDKTMIHVAPNAVDATQPVWSDNGLLNVESNCNGTLTVKPDHDLAIDNMLYQDRLTGDHTEICQQFIRMWGPMWNRHADATPDRWDQVISQVVGPMPQAAEQMHMPPITTDDWMQAVRQKKQRGAMGPDGINKADMMHLSQVEIQAFIDLFHRVEHQEMPWPTTMLVGLISALEKRSCALHPQDYRPITVLSYAYRIWSTIRSKQLLRWLDSQCPATLIGNRPRHAAADIWWGIALEVEDSVYNSRECGGLITDVCKAFNVLPRGVIQAIALRCGIPKSFILCWHSAAEHLQRRFMISGGCSSPVYSCTGYAEGDPLSVVAMQLMNLGLHQFFQRSALGSELYSYVDNWEILTSNPDRIAEAFDKVAWFAEQVDLVLDRSKTHAWALGTAKRTMLRKQEFNVQLQATDLGGQMVYCRKHIVQTIKSRIAQNQSLWHWLRKSLAPEKQKLKILLTVAWARCLHGIANLCIGQDHFNKMRGFGLE